MMTVEDMPICDQSIKSFVTAAVYIAKRKGLATKENEGYEQILSKSAH